MTTSKKNRIKIIKSQAFGHICQMASALPERPGNHEAYRHKKLVPLQWFLWQVCFPWTFLFSKAFFWQKATRVEGKRINLKLIQVGHGSKYIKRYWRVGGIKFSSVLIPKKKKETVASPQGNEGCSPCLLPNPTSCRSAKLDPTGQWDTEKTGSTRQGQVANNTLMFLLVYFKGIEGCSGTICPRLDSSSRSTKN